MSVSNHKGKKCMPISGPKVGPLKATLPVASLMRQDPNPNKCKSSSPTASLRRRFSPDGPISGQRSPGSLSYKGFRAKGLGSKPNSMRRTASLDAIYLKGHWPTDLYFMHFGNLKIDKATQTEENWSDKKSRSIDTNSESVSLDKYLKHRLRTGRSQGLGLRLISPPATCDPSPTATPPYSSHEGLHSPVQISALPSPCRQPLANRPPMRGSIEGLNQEIERLDLKDFDEKIAGLYGSIPEGHRAPLADLLRQTRSVNTQTPGGQDELDTGWGSSGPSSRGSMSPQYYLELSLNANRHESCGSSPDDGTRSGTSPHINRFLAREPPDGCERVNLRLEEARRFSGPGVPPLKPITTGLFKPSLGSAFQPLYSMLNGECSGIRNSPSPQQSD